MIRLHGLVRVTQRADASALFYALLMKDLGCSSNSAKMCYLFGSDDRAAKAAAKTVEWTNTARSLRYVASYGTHHRCFSLPRLHPDGTPTGVSTP